MNNHSLLEEIMPSMTVQWVGALALYRWDRKRLVSGKWLNSSLINSAQTLIKRAYPHAHGLQDTQATRTTLPDADFVQILHVNNSHWLTVSTINLLPGTVHI